MPVTADRASRVAAQLASILSDLSGIEPSSLDPTASFTELGFDSLFLTQANAQFRKRFGVPVTFRQLFEEAPSISALAMFIDGRLAPDAFADPAAQAQVAAPANASPVVDLAAPAPAATGLSPAEPEPSTGQRGATSGAGTGDAVQRLIDEQLRLMEKQLDLLRWGMGQASGPGAPTLALPTPALPTSVAPTPALPTPSAPTQAAPADVLPAAPKRRHYLATGDQGTGDGQRPDRPPAGGDRGPRPPLQRADPGSKRLRPALARHGLPTTARSSGFDAALEGARLPDRLRALEGLAASGTSTATSTSTLALGFGTNLLRPLAGLRRRRGSRAARAGLRGRRPEPTSSARWRSWPADDRQRPAGVHDLGG